MRAKIITIFIFFIYFNTISMLLARPRVAQKAPEQSLGGNKTWQRIELKNKNLIKIKVYKFKKALSGIKFYFREKDQKISMTTIGGDKWDTRHGAQLVGILEKKDHKPFKIINAKIQSCKKNGYLRSVKFSIISDSSLESETKEFHSNCEPNSHHYQYQSKHAGKAINGIMIRAAWMIDEIRFIFDNEYVKYKKE